MSPQYSLSILCVYPRPEQTEENVCFWSFFGTDIHDKDDKKKNRLAHIIKMETQRYQRAHWEKWQGWLWLKLLSSNNNL